MHLHKFRSSGCLNNARHILLYFDLSRSNIVAVIATGLGCEIKAKRNLCV
jgi:hypothetical protein